MPFRISIEMLQILLEIINRTPDEVLASIRRDYHPGVPGFGVNGHDAKFMLEGMLDSLEEVSR